MIRILMSLFTVVLFTCSSLAQNRPDPKHPEEENLKLPADWEVRLDHSDADVTIGDTDSADVFFVNMTPGWHITTGPAGIFYLPGNTASGTYRASTKIYLFDPKGRNEAFGIFIGGQNLDADGHSYTYFLLRNSGEFLIKKRMGDDTKVVKDWSSAPMMTTYEDTTQSSVPNTLAIEVGNEQVDFFVNDEQVHSLPKSDVDTDGIVGLRINHALNVHVEDLKVEEM
jgi:hypothetical protein